MNRKKMMWLLCAATAMGLGVNQASALTVNSSGDVTDWGVTPFSDTIPTTIITTNGPTTLTGVNGNNYSPIEFPYGVGYNPSPGGRVGERFDLEGLYAYRDGAQVNVLLVASSGFKARGGGTTFKLGDLLIDVDHNGTFDYGVVTQHGNAGLTQGGVYDIDKTRGIQRKRGSYYRYPEITNAIGGWAVKEGTLLSQGTIDTTTHDYGSDFNGQNENGTWLYQYTFTMDEALQYHDLYMQLAWGCGNDMIGLTLAAQNKPQGRSQPPPSPPGTPTPEPATAVMGLLGLGGLLIAGRR